MTCSCEGINGRFVVVCVLPADHKEPHDLRRWTGYGPLEVTALPKKKKWWRK